MELPCLGTMPSVQKLTQHCCKTHPAHLSRQKAGPHSGAGLHVQLHSITRPGGKHLLNPTRKPNSPLQLEAVGLSELNLLGVNRPWDLKTSSVLVI